MKGKGKTATESHLSTRWRRWSTSQARGGALGWADCVRDALEQFENALELNPTPIEAQAALYNKACCHAYREESKKAAECLRAALRDYNLKFGTILNDPDLAPFRASPEFKELQEEALRGREDIGSGFRRDMKLISEVQAPFRGVRRFFYVALTAAAGISTFFTIPRLILAVQGGDGIVVLVALYFWENKKEEKQSYKYLVILAGSKESVTREMQRAERYRTELLKRSVLLIPVIFGASQKDQTKPRGLGTRRASASVPSVGGDFEKRTESIAAKSRLKAELRFKADVFSPEHWESWIRDQQESEGVTPGYAKLEWHIALPRLEDLISKLE
ncbi:hypothetical protein U9M48_019787, partial [Paspalum notatum var. saurae]